MTDRGRRRWDVGGSGAAAPGGLPDHRYLISKLRLNAYMGLLDSNLHVVRGPAIVGVQCSRVHPDEETAHEAKLI